MFDPLLHQPVRSRLMALLISNNTLPFKVLKQKLELTDGNLSSHLKKLESANYILITKDHHEKRTVTNVTVTPHGYKIFSQYINKLQQYINSTLE